LITGKKKHLKKIIEHINKYLAPQNISNEIISDIINVAKNQNCPILLGKTMKQFMEKGVKISTK